MDDALPISMSSMMHHGRHDALPISMSSMIMIIEAVSLLKHVDEEDHASTLESLIRQYDEHGDTYELLDSIESKDLRKS